ncbi:MAG: hypothetical protein QM687_00465 [Ferruginibacter sp.]
MRTLLTTLIVFCSIAAAAQNVGIGLSNPLAQLHVQSTDPLAVMIDGPAGFYIALREAGVYRGYWGSYAGNATDIDMGTGVGNTTGAVNLTIQGVPKLTVTTDGNTNLAGELNSTVKTGNANLVPICYGNVSSAGAVQAGTGNFTVEHTSTGFYQVTITGEAYHFQQYITVVTPIGTLAPAIAATGSGGGKLQVQLYNISGADVDNNFHFVVYKP